MCTQSGGSGLVLLSGSDLKNRLAETYLGALWALKLLEGESNPWLMERSCLDCLNSDAVVALTLVAQSTAAFYLDRIIMSAFVTLCQVNYYGEPVAPRGVPALRVCVFLHSLTYLLLLISVFIVLFYFFFVAMW